jgi:hypothetical protein
MQFTADTIEQRDAEARLAFERALAEDRLRVEAGNALIERELARTVREVRPVRAPLQFCDTHNQRAAWFSRVGLR